MVDPAAAAEEQARADRLRRTVDVACAVLRQGRLSRAEAEALVADTRRRALVLFPGKEDVRPVLAPRFRRSGGVLHTAPEGGPSARLPRDLIRTEKGEYFVPATVLNGQNDSPRNASGDGAFLVISDSRT
jgi:hypothetical protein